MFSGFAHPPIFHGQPLPDPISPRSTSRKPDGAATTSCGNPNCGKDHKADGKVSAERKGSTDSAEINPRDFDARAPPTIGLHTFANPNTMMYPPHPAMSHPMFYPGYGAPMSSPYCPPYMCPPGSCPMGCCPPPPTVYCPEACCKGKGPIKPQQQPSFSHHVYGPRSHPTTQQTSVPPVKEVDKKQEDDGKADEKK